MNEKSIKVDTDFIIKSKSQYYEIAKRIEKIGNELSQQKLKSSQEVIQISKQLHQYCKALEDIAYTYSNRE